MNPSQNHTRAAGLLLLPAPVQMGLAWEIVALENQLGYNQGGFSTDQWPLPQPQTAAGTHSHLAHPVQASSLGWQCPQSPCKDVQCGAGYPVRGSLSNAQGDRLLQSVQLQKGFDFWSHRRLLL